jgi:hypothetical protein
MNLGADAMMGERTATQEALFYGFSLERHVPGDHLLRKIDRFVDLSGVRAHLEPYYSDVLRKLFETVVARCMREGLVGGEAFAVGASLIVADAHRRRGVAKVEDLNLTSNRAVAEDLAVLDDAAFGGATPVAPKAISPTDPAARYTAAADAPAVYACSDNYLVDVEHAVIMDVEATTAVRQAEVGAARTMLDRTADQFDARPSRLIADAGYGSAEMLGWLVEERGIEPHVKVFDKSERTDGTFSRSDFAYDPQAELYLCPDGKELRKRRRLFSALRSEVTKEGVILYRASKRDCEVCALKPKCTPNMPACKIARCIHEAARDKARAIAKTEAYVVSRRQRKKVEMLFADLKRILKLDRLRLRGPNGAKDESLIAATAQNLRKLAKLVPLRTSAFAT